jgi:hypothetical protein
MSEQVKNFIDQVADGNNVDAGEAFKDALRAKIGDALDTKRKELASSLFNKANATPEAQSFSDPKPEIADPGTFNPDGSVSTEKDGEAQINLAQVPTDGDAESK